MDLDLKGRHALVCGATEGIGRATAHELALLGADVTVLARREDALREVVAALPRNGEQQHGWIAADVSRTDALQRPGRGTVQRQTRAYPREQHRRPTRRPRASGGHRRIPRCIQQAPDREPDPGAGGAPGHARSGVGAHRQRDLDIGERTDRRVGRVQHGARRRRELGQDPVAANSHRWASRSTTSCPASRKQVVSRSSSATVHGHRANPRTPSPIRCASSFRSGVSRNRRKSAASSHSCVRRRPRTSTA